MRQYSFSECLPFGVSKALDCHLIVLLLEELGSSHNPACLTLLSWIEVTLLSLHLCFFKFFQILSKDTLKERKNEFTESKVLLE